AASVSARFTRMSPCSALRRCSALPPPMAAGTRAKPSAPTVTIASTATRIRFMASGIQQFALFGVGLFECFDEIGFFVEVAGPLGELRLGDAGRAVAADQHAVRIFADDVVEENVLRHDHVAFHPKNLGDVG